MKLSAADCNCGFGFIFAHLFGPLKATTSVLFVVTCVGNTIIEIRSAPACAQGG